jgi:hypothetical protein
VFERSTPPYIAANTDVDIATTYLYFSQGTAVQFELAVPTVCAVQLTKPFESRGYVGLEMYYEASSPGAPPPPDAAAGTEAGDDKLPVWAIVLIVFGSVGVLSLTVCCVRCFCTRKQQAQDDGRVQIMVGPKGQPPISAYPTTYPQQQVSMYPQQQPLPPVVYPQNYPQSQEPTYPSQQATTYPPTFPSTHSLQPRPSNATVSYPQPADNMVSAMYAQSSVSFEVPADGADFNSILQAVESLRIVL